MSNLITKVIDNADLWLVNSKVINEYNSVQMNNAYNILNIAVLFPSNFALFSWKKIFEILVSEYSE